MDDATDPDSARDASPMPLTRRELRQRREAAAIAKASGARPAASAAEHATAAEHAARTEPAAAGTTAPPAPAPGPVQDGSGTSPHPPGGASFGSLAGMFAGTVAQVSAQPTVLTVCTGNICRSPLAETLLRSHLSGLDLRVHSAGTHALVGHAMTDPAQRLAEDRGVDPALFTAHRGRLLTEPLLDDADLILTMTAQHREDAVQLQPRRLHRIFAVREFARLAQGLDDARVREIADGAGENPRGRLVAVVEAVAARRGGTASTDEDVMDPYRRSTAVYEESAAQLTPALDEVERVLRAALA